MRSISSPTRSAGAFPSAAASWPSATPTSRGSRRPCRSRRTDPLLHRLVGEDAEELAALQPAAIAIGLEPAPFAAALEQLGDDPGLEPHHRTGAAAGVAVQHARAGQDQRGAVAGQHALMHPADGALPVADLAPD